MDEQTPNEITFKWTTVIDGVGMVSWLLLINIIFAVPIYFSFKFNSFSSPIFIHIVGNKPHTFSICILCFGYTFILFTIILYIFYKKKTQLFETFIGTALIGLDIIFAILTISFSNALLGSINSSKCEKYENRLVYSLFSQNSSKEIIKWRQDAHCIYDVECQIAAHQFMGTNCRSIFTVNLIFTCLQVAFFLFGLIFTITGVVLNPYTEEEEDSQT